MAKTKRGMSKREYSNGLILIFMFLVILTVIWVNSFLRVILHLNSWQITTLFVFVVIISLASFVLIKIWPHWIKMRRYRSLKIDDVDSMPGHEFEHYVAQLMEHHGFRTTVTKGSGDLGVDIIAHKEAYSYSVQCKRYNDNISRTAVSDAVAGRQHYRCTHAMVVTNRYFTTGAVELAKSTECILIDRAKLAQWVDNFQRHIQIK